MNKIEELVYHAVKKNPALKQFIRNIYQSAFDCLPKQKNQFKNKLVFREGYFFGFHDISPFSIDDTKLLAQRADFDLRMPNPGEKLDVGYFDFKDGVIGSFHKIGESIAWNWHKGCRLQWYDDDKVIFNTSNGIHPIAVIETIDGRLYKELPHAIDAIFNNDKERIATSFSYTRLERCMPGYGYPYNDDGLIQEYYPKQTGLFLMNTETGDRELLVSLDELANSIPKEMKEKYLHFVTHSEFSPDGRYISFLYRRIPFEGNYMKRWTQIRVYDRKNKCLYTLPTQDSGSHYVWNNCNQLIASCIINGKSCHVLYDMNAIDNYKIIAPHVLNSDGHQSFVGNSKFVTDTYPDKRRMAHIYEVDIDNNNCKEIVSVYSPKQFQTKDFKCHIACDLHPRVSKSGKYLCFDSPSSGKRGIYVMNL
ncbi:hypothetical protein [Lepagella muris]|jgi:hypothetical protein|uniref:Uncharacterized protein n=1 Tax=Lepagella muris TaxID=3032870 RepID=A0AC61RD56_9BACT|nr:hypothetical protein [Lepagella muris]ROT09970.1 hypothetical protein EEL33_00840 [Muribaculaceae bacterium Isolate-037 (Harlan)]TGY76486.1 hypothetical protein E5331_17860 [Lepagella muris]THG47950.1 hypothetical protein E5984_16950 [Bacteroidales bacterium]TKC64337.1 hypothetical protein E5359_003290 [Bacteroidales bacterium]